MPRPLTVVTGAAGFIGFHVASRLLERGDEVLGLDNLNDYYPVALKAARLDLLARRPGFTFRRLDLATPEAVEAIAAARPARVVHLAAQAGVRHAAKDPGSYLQSNLVGFGHVLEGCRRAGVEHLVYASSSSVYGATERFPSSAAGPAEHPVNLYAATKRANELMAHAYAHQHGLACTGLRFFTVYGPWGRPDMAPLLFSERLLDGRPIDVHGHGRMRRDFTYVDDTAAAVVAVLDRPAAASPGWSSASPDRASSCAPYRLYDVGGGRPVELLRFIEILEDALGATAQLRFVEMASGEVPVTCADAAALERDFGIRPRVTLEEGLGRMAAWYLGWRGQGVQRPRAA
jgi:UDP-glucuronate 4-epimerase